MKAEKIIRSYIWKRVRESEALGYQCVAWVKEFAKQLWEPIKWFSGSALEWWKTWSPFVGTRWVRCENKDTNFPSEGDIFFLDKTKGNPYGHTGVVGKGSNKTEMIVIEQNALTGNWLWTGWDVITERRIKYQGSRWNVLGWYTLTPEPSGFVWPDFVALSIKAGIWGGTNPKDPPTRAEAAKMLITASGKNANEIWNSKDANAYIRPDELKIMAKRAFPDGRLSPLVRTRSQLALFCYHQMSKK